MTRHVECDFGLSEYTEDLAPTTPSDTVIVNPKRRRCLIASSMSIGLLRLLPTDDHAAGQPFPLPA